MPRLSVDIDLTYIHVEERTETLAKMQNALGRISNRIQKSVSEAVVKDRRDVGKLQISVPGAEAKIETNLVSRGVLAPCRELPLCETAQKEFDAFCEINVVPFGQLYGGKICAALDRQHPRDLFDVKQLLENEGITEDVKAGLIFSLLSNPRPIDELVFPNMLDQRTTLEKHFAGMSADVFSYEQFESVREELVRTVIEGFSDDDCAFLLGFHRLDPDWSYLDLRSFPSVVWKLRNLEDLKRRNRGKFELQIRLLEKALS